MNQKVAAYGEKNTLSLSHNWNLAAEWRNVASREQSKWYIELEQNLHADVWLQGTSKI